jgi:arylsulfatase
MATCVDLAKAEYPTRFNGNEIHPLEGQSLQPLLTGVGEFAERTLYWEHEGNAAVRAGNRKLVRQGARGEWELFDLGADRTEQANLATANPDEVSDLQKQWRQWAKSHQVLPKPTKKKKKK